MENDIEILYKKWCKETKRNDALLVGESIREFFNWLKTPEPVEISRIVVNTKYRTPISPSTVAIYMTKIPELVKILNEKYIIIKK